MNTPPMDPGIDLSHCTRLEALVKLGIRPKFRQLRHGGFSSEGGWIGFASGCLLWLDKHFRQQNEKTDALALSLSPAHI